MYTGHLEDCLQFESYCHQSPVSALRQSEPGAQEVRAELGELEQKKGEIESESVVIVRPAPVMNPGGEIRVSGRFVIVDHSQPFHLLTRHGPAAEILLATLELMENILFNVGHCCSN